MDNQGDEDHSWKKLYETAILELDETKIPLRIEEAKHAILDRVQELLQGSNGGGSEVHRLDDALNMLQHLQRMYSEDAVRKPNTKVTEVRRVS